LGADVSAAVHDWSAWMRRLGLHVRRVREFVGLSQEELARLAGVSQGAVSRIESGKQLGTPLLVAVKVESALIAALRTLNPDILSDELRSMAEAEQVSFPVHGGSTSPLALTRDPGLDELLDAYRALPDRQREALRAIVRNLAAALRHQTVP
jgi:transcriptional regulator with XRE-family HTH domain